MCKGSFEKRPHPRKVPSVWNPTPVLDIFMHWHLPLSYAQLVRKGAFILAILSGRCLLDLFNLHCDVSHLQISNNFLQLVPAYLSKTDKASHLPQIVERGRVSLPSGSHPHPLGSKRRPRLSTQPSLLQRSSFKLHSDPQNLQRIHHEKPSRCRHCCPTGLHTRHRSFICLRQRCSNG
jgi:hypothetical protein